MSVSISCKAIVPYACDPIQAHGAICANPTETLDIAQDIETASFVFEDPMFVDRKQNIARFYQHAKSYKDALTTYDTALRNHQLYPSRHRRAPPKPSVDNINYSAIHNTKLLIEPPPSRGGPDRDHKIFRFFGYLSKGTYGLVCDYVCSDTGGTDIHIAVKIITEGAIGEYNTINDIKNNINALLPITRSHIVSDSTESTRPNTLVSIMPLYTHTLEYVIRTMCGTNHMTTINAQTEFDSSINMYKSYLSEGARFAVENLVYPRGIQFNNMNLPLRIPMDWMVEILQSLDCAQTELKEKGFVVCDFKGANAMVECANQNSHIGERNYRMIIIDTGGVKYINPPSSFTTTRATTDDWGATFPVPLRDSTPDQINVWNKFILLYCIVFGPQGIHMAHGSCADLGIDARHYTRLEIAIFFMKTLARISEPQVLK